MSFNQYDYNFDSIKQISTKDKLYNNSPTKLRRFYHFSPDLKGFKDILEDKSNKSYDRGTLCSILSEQYEKRGTNDEVLSNIQALKSENTYTIITAHQPTLLTGPLYYIIKILSAIRLTEQLKVHFPKFTFVPMFVLGGEDHDFEECNHLNLFKNKITWKNDKGGAVGRLDLEALDEVVEDIKEILGHKASSIDLMSALELQLKKSKNYGDLILNLTDYLFKDYGLVVLSMDDTRFKSQMIDIFKDDILNHTSYQKVLETQNELADIPFKPQASPREINLFYLGENSRKRIVFEQGVYKVLGTELTFTQESLIKNLKEHPSRFSPNVILRPIMQEKCLPNLAYVGGGGEIAYWLERKSQFEYYDLKMPLLIRRDSIQIISKTIYSKLENMGFSDKDIFTTLDKLKSVYTQKNSVVSFDLDTYMVKMNHIFDEIIENVKDVDVNLVKTVEALSSKTKKGLESVDQKFLRAQKRKLEVELNKIEKTYNQIFPKQKLMERHTNIIECLYLYGNDFISELYHHIDPFNKTLKVLVEK